MSNKEDILEIEGVWTAEEVKNIKNWIQGEEGVRLMGDQTETAIEESKAIHAIAHVDVDKLKTPFTYTL